MKKDGKKDQIDKVVKRIWKAFSLWLRATQLTQVLGLKYQVYNHCLRCRSPFRSPFRSRFRCWFNKKVELPPRPVRGRRGRSERHGHGHGRGRGLTLTFDYDRSLAHLPYSLSMLRNENTQQQQQKQQRAKSTLSPAGDKQPERPESSSTNYWKLPEVAM